PELAKSLNEPSLLLYPRPLAHRFVTDREQGADFVCANLTFEGGLGNPISAALPAIVCLPLTAIAGAEPILTMLFSEAEKDYCGRQAVLDRLFEVVMIWLLRVLMDQGKVESGMMAGLGHPKLKLALVAMHDEPQRDWSLQTLAAEAGMSRTVFANGFRDVVGCTPGTYLQRWRIGLAQKSLRSGRGLKHIASDIGYSGEAALSRAFRDHTGLSPREWLKQDAAALT
ncbi:MAG: AraC family transcriptional regulator, partial [Rubrivivax sp.]